MNKVLVTLMCLFAGSSANSAVYHFFNGEKLAEAAMEWEKAQSSPKGADLHLITEFAGYVGGLFDYLSVKQHICVQDEITKIEVLGVVTDYLKNKSIGLQNSGSVLVEKALYKKYPCK